MACTTTSDMWRTGRYMGDESPQHGKYWEDLPGTAVVRLRLPVRYAVFLERTLRPPREIAGGTFVTGVGIHGGSDGSRGPGGQQSPRMLIDLDV